MSIILPFKNKLRQFLIDYKIDLTKNLEYDRLTHVILKTVLKSDTQTIDVGCHKGEILDLILKYAPQGHHYAFEPLPDFYKNLVEKYSNQKNVSIYNNALSNTAGETEFTFVKNNPAYSGFIERDYDNKEVQIEKIKVQKAVLDEIIPKEANIGLMKIDVEGAELQVLEGSVETLKRCKPVIVFEHGMGASDFYGTLPKDIFNLLHDSCGYQIYTLKSFTGKKNPLTYEEFNAKFFSRKDYYFVASH